MAEHPSYCILCDEWIRYVDKSECALGGYLCQSCEATVPRALFPVLEKIHRRIDDTERRIEELEKKRN